MNAQIDPFASVRMNPIQRKEPEQKEQEIPKELLEDQKGENQEEEDPFSNVRIKEAKGFPGIKEVGRHAVRLGSRIAETIGGIPGDLQSLIDSGIFVGVEALTGHKLPEEAKTRKFPTSGEIKEKSEEIFGELVKPKNETEKTIDEYAERVASLVGPMKFRRALGIGLASQATKEGLKISGLGEGTQEAGALGTMFLLSVMNPKGALKYSTSQYEKANQIAKGISINAQNLEKNITNLITDLKKGVPTTSKNSVLKPAEALLDKVKNGKIGVQDLTAAKRDISSIMGEPETLSGSKKLLKVLGKEVDTAIKPFEKIRPDFSKVYRPANEIFSAVMEGKKASNFLKKTLGSKSIIGATLAEMALGHPEAILPTLGLASSVVGAARTIDFFTRLAKSPELRKYYGRALMAAAKEDSGAVRHYADKIEEIMGKD